MESCCLLRFGVFLAHDPSGQTVLNAKGEFMVSGKSNGFTLIELMIVVAIVGILAAVAIPAYQDYVAKAQRSEALTLLGGLKTPTREYFAQTGGVPTLSALGNPALTGEYVSSITLAATSSQVTYTATFKTTGVAPGLSGTSVQMIYDPSDESFSWNL